MNSPDLPLKDIHLPETIGWWPLAWGWWAVLVLGVLAIVGGIWLIRRITRKTALKSAKKLLLQLQQQQNESLQQLAALSVLMRRTAISLYPRTEIASLTGAAWLAFLDRSLKDKPFSEGIGQVLKDAHYRQQPPEDLDLAALYRLCSDWLNAQTQPSRTTQRKK